MLEKEFKYYKDHQKDLVKKYEGRFLTIVGEEVVGDHPTQLEAYLEAKKKYEMGSFLIQHCLPGEGSYTQTFHSRVAFKIPA